MFMSRFDDHVKTKAARSVVWATNAKILSQVLGFVTMLILARLLNRADFGLMAMAMTVMGLIDNFMDLGFLQAIIQATEVDRKQLASCFWFLTGISLLVCAGLWGAAPYIGAAFSEGKVAGIIRFLAPIVLLAPANIVSKGILSRVLSLDVIARIELLSSAVKMAVSIAFAAMGLGVWSLVIGYGVERVLLTGSAMIAAKWYPMPTLDVRGVLGLLAFGSQTTAGSILWYIYTKADVFVIGRLLGAEVLGIYTIAAQFPQTVTRLLPNTWVNVAYPVFSKYKDSPRLQEILSKASSHLMLVCLPLFTGLAVTAPDFVRVFFGAHWQAATLPMRILSIVAAIEASTILLPKILNAKGKPGMNVAVNLIAAVLFPAVMYWGASRWGLQGVLWASVALYSYRYLAFLLLACNFVGLRLESYVRDHMGSIVAALIMLAVVSLFREAVAGWNSSVKLMFSVGIGALAYVISQLIVGKEQIDSLVGFMKAK
jgi:O-antigen/teichoic acid export membrane protein